MDRYSEQDPGEGGNRQERMAEGVREGAGSIPLGAAEVQ